MKQIKATLASELIKLKRSKIFWITFGLFIFIPMMMGVLIYIAKNPELSSKYGLISTKAAMFGDNDWKGYFTIINQIIAAIGLIGFGFVTAWVFGREYIDKTITNILVMPASRTSIVISKFIIISIWCIILAIVLLLTALIIGTIIDIPGKSADMITDNLKIYAETAGLTILLSTPVAFLASYGRGIFAPLGFVIVTMIMAQFVSLSGIGAFFPWAIPGINTVTEGSVGMELVPASYGIVILTSLVGFTGTIIWWNKADHH